MPFLQNLSSLINSIPIPALGLNFLDFFIIIIILFYALEGFSVGFITSFFDLLSFVLSFILGLKFYSFAGGFLIDFFSMPAGFANALGFFITAFVSEIILSIMLKKLSKFLQRFFTQSSQERSESPNLVQTYIKTLNCILGFFPGVVSSLILLSFFLTLIISLPFSPFLKSVVSSSRIGGLLVANTQGVEKRINDVFGGALSDTLNFLTVEPKSDEFVELNFKITEVKSDFNAERQMAIMINKERNVNGLPSLVFDEKLSEVARKHSKDMFARGYFSHISPEGISPFDRMGIANINYSYAGENLALAPSVDLAMQGLMNSPGHKANILSPDFKKVGIGVMDGGIYGEMFSQEFTD